MTSKKTVVIRLHANMHTWNWQTPDYFFVGTMFYYVSTMLQISVGMCGRLNIANNASNYLGPVYSYFSHRVFVCILSADCRAPLFLVSEYFFCPHPLYSSFKTALIHILQSLLMLVLFLISIIPIPFFLLTPLCHPYYFALVFLWTYQNT